MADDDYRMEHRAPGPDEAPAHDLTQIMPADVYTHPHYYDTGGGTTDHAFDESHRVVRKIRGNPEAKVHIYRALPAEHAHKGFQPGDWVSLSKDYARQHGITSEDPKHDWPVIRTTVPAKHLNHDGNDLNEFGYNGPAKDGMVSFKGGYHQEIRHAADGAIVPVKRRTPKTAGRLPAGAEFHFTPADPARRADHHELAMHAGGTEVGKLSWGHDGDISGVDTHHRYRHQGIATALYTKAHELSQEHGIEAPGGTVFQTPDGKGFRSHFDALSERPDVSHIETHMHRGKGEDDTDLHAHLIQHHYPRDTDLVHSWDQATAERVHDKITKFDSCGWQKQASMEDAPLRFHYDEQETGGSKYPTEATLTAVHPDHGEVGSLKYFPPKRSNGQILIRNLDVHPDHRRKGYGSALMDELQTRMPNASINHGDRTDDGKAWWASYGQGKADKRGRTAVRQLPRPTARAVVAEEKPVTLYRGLHLGDADEAEVAHLHRDPAGYFAQHAEKHAGIHWTDNPNSAANFALGADPDGNSHEDYDYDEDEEPHHNHGVILHAQVHPKHILQPGSEEWQNYADFAGVFEHDHPEAERTVRDGAPVHITHITGISTDPQGYSRDTTVPHRMHVQASASREVALPDDGPMTMDYIRNPESSTAHGDFGEQYGQHIEPAGRYINQGSHAPEGWEGGTVTFQKPLHLHWGDEGYQHPSNWKRQLSDRYDGKTGEELSRAVAADGHDGIVTHDKHGTSEIVDLRHLHRQLPKPTAAAMEDQDEDDTPATWYHGTNSNFSGFRFEQHGEGRKGSHWNNALGVHFASDHDVAKHHFGPRVIHAQVDLKNPKHYASEFDMDREAHEHAQRSGINTGIAPEHASDPHSLWGHMSHSPARDDIAHSFKQHLMEQGHDGVVYGNEMEGDGKPSAIAFHPHQINITKDEGEVDPYSRSRSWTQHLRGARLPKPTARAVQAVDESDDVWWHGTGTGDLRGGQYGLHVGTHRAATEALTSRIGHPAHGVWDGTRAYGETMLAGKKTLNARGISITGHNCGVPDHDHLPDPNGHFPHDSHMKPEHKPDIFPLQIKGPMGNDPHDPHRDSVANDSMKRSRGSIGYYYRNVGEDPGSVSAVVPHQDHIERIPQGLSHVDYHNAEQYHRPLKDSDYDSDEDEYDEDDHHYGVKLPKPTAKAVEASGATTNGHTSTWDEIGDRHPHVYGEDGDGEGIGWAASHLAHSRPDDPDAENHSVYDLDFQHERVDPKHIDYARIGPHDPRVQHARQGYRISPKVVPPLVLVHRHGVYHVADGHHRAQAAALEHQPSVNAYVAYSPYPDEPFEGGSTGMAKGPFHGAEPHPGNRPSTAITHTAAASEEDRQKFHMDVQRIVDKVGDDYREKHMDDNVLAHNDQPLHLSDIPDAHKGGFRFQQNTEAAPRDEFHDLFHELAGTPPEEIGRPSHERQPHNAPVPTTTYHHPSNFERLHLDEHGNAWRRHFTHGEDDTVRFSHWSGPHSAVDTLENHPTFSQKVHSDGTRTVNWRSHNDRMRRQKVEPTDSYADVRMKHNKAFNAAGWGVIGSAGLTWAPLED